MTHKIITKFAHFSHENFDSLFVHPIKPNELSPSDEWVAADLHVHSTSSYDVLPTDEFHPEALYRKAIDMGMGFVSITDHDTMDAYNIIGWERPKLVPGVEIGICDRKRVGHTIHINVYNLNKSQFREILDLSKRERNLEKTIHFFKEEKLPFVYNHPFWFSPEDSPDFRAVESIIDLFPVVEYNMKRVRRKNMLAVSLASRYDKGVIAATDTHIGKIGETFTIARGKTFDKFFENVKKRNAFIVPQDLNITNLNIEITEWIKTLFNLKVGRNERVRFTGIAPVDAAINFMVRKSGNGRTWRGVMAEALLNRVANTGLFSFVYLQSQNYIASEIAQLLQLKDTR